MAGLSIRPDVWLFPGRFWEARSVGDFWGKWNPALHWMCLVIIRLIRRRVKTRLVLLPSVLVVFVLMGWLHDAASWILKFGAAPLNFWFTYFFAANGVVVAIEHTKCIPVPLPDSVKRFLTFLWITVMFIVTSEISH